MMQVNSETVLIVDDDDGIALLEKRSLERAGYRVLMASTAGQALQTLREQHIDLLLLDYFLPGSPDGLDIYDRVKQINKDLPVILVTGYSNEGLVIRALRAGVRDFVAKSPKYIEYLPEAAKRVLAQVDMESRLRKSENQLATIVATSHDAIIALDAELHITLFNRGAEVMFQCSSDQACGQSIHRFIPILEADPGSAAPSFVIANGKAAATQPSRIEVQGERLDGVKLELEISVVGSGLGSPNSHTLFAHDITDRKRQDDIIQASLKEKEMLLREIHHRVKNNLQIISSLLKLQTDYLTDKRAVEIFKASQNRIKAMAMIHGKLYHSSDLAKIDFGAYIRNLVNDLYRSYGFTESGIRLNLDLQDAYLGIDTAIPCGLLLNELVSNSLKHGFPDNRKGLLGISFRSSPESRFKLTVEDDGIGMPDHIDYQKTESLGLQLVTALTEQLGATVVLARENGTLFEITFAELSYKQRR